MRQDFSLSEAIADYWRVMDERQPYRGPERRKVEPQAQAA
jgi:hypothetical protein